MAFLLNASFRIAVYIAVNGLRGRVIPKQPLFLLANNYIHTSGSWGTVKYPVSEGREAAYTKTNALQHLCFVIAAFCETIGIWNIKSVENILRPIVQSLNTAIMYLSSHKRFRNVRGSNTPFHVFTCQSTRHFATLSISHFRLNSYQNLET